MPERHGSQWLMKIAQVVILLLIVIAAAASFLPMIETDAWWIRYLDFVRLQAGIALLILLVLCLVSGGWRSRGGLMVAALGLAALGYHAYRLSPYRSGADAMALAVESCPAGSRLSVMVANVLRGNEQSEPLFTIIEDVEPDLVLLLETDAWWDEALQDLHGQFPYQVRHIPEHAAYYGMHLLSRHPLLDPEVRFLVGAEIPTIVTGVALPDGQGAQFIGLHPRPPLPWNQPTTLRDAHLLMAAMEARASDRPTILAGDFNAVPWERVTRRAMRIGGLLDPRVGRGLHPTFSADSWPMAWPIDHVLYQDSFGLAAWEVLPAFGSDHYPIRADLCLLPDLAQRQSAPPLREGDLEDAEATVRAAQEMRP